MSSDLSFDPEYKNNLSMCPFCGSNNFDNPKDESADDLHYMTFRWKCLDCHNEWYEEWNFNRRFYVNDIMEV
jgi:predicted nucleic-acid-binding Zn-ribbon protein